MIVAGSEPQALELEVGAQTGEEMVALRSLPAGRGLLQRGVLFKRFVIDLDTPPFLIERRDLVISARQIVGDQIAQARRAVSVFEDFFGQQEWEIYLFQPNFTGRVHWQVERTNCHILTALLVRPAQCNLAVVLEREDEMFVQDVVDVLHIVG